MKLSYCGTTPSTLPHIYLKKAKKRFVQSAWVQRRLTACALVYVPGRTTQAHSYTRSHPFTHTRKRATFWLRFLFLLVSGCWSVENIINHEVDLFFVQVFTVFVCPSRLGTTFTDRLTISSFSCLTFSLFGLYPLLVVPAATGSACVGE